MSKIILITGASTGFGRDTAETLAGAGHTVFASMRNPQEKNRDHAETLRKQGIEVIELDVTSDASVDRAVKAVLTRAKRIDVLINNAGIASAGVTEAFTADQTKIVFNTNVVGLLRTTRAVLPAMRRPPRITRVDRAQLHPQRRRYGLSGGELADPRGDNMPPNWPRSRRMSSSLLPAPQP